MTRPLPPACRCGRPDGAPIHIRKSSCPEWVPLPSRQDAIMRRLRSTNFRGRARTPKHATTVHLLRVLTG